MMVCLIVVLLIIIFSKFKIQKTKIFYLQKQKFNSNCFDSIGMPMYIALFYFVFIKKLIYIYAII